MADHNEALRLAQALKNRQEVEDEAAALLRQQAERIAELEAELLKRHQRLHDTEELAGQYLAQRDDATTERDQLRAEVETLKVALRMGAEAEVARAHEVVGLRAELALRPWRQISPARIAALWAEACKPDRPTRDMVEAFVRLVEADHGIDHARTTHKDEA